MKINKLENCSQAVDEFQAGVKKGEINDQQMAKIIETSNVMLSRVMSPFPYFYNYLSAVNAFTKQKGILLNLPVGLISRFKRLKTKQRVIIKNS
jgi:hypothetical protein